MSKKNPGKLVQHEDGRKGIAYHDDQDWRWRRKEKVVVQFIDENHKPKGKKRAVHQDKLSQIGYVD